MDPLHSKQYSPADFWHIPSDLFLDSEDALTSQVHPSPLLSSIIRNKRIAPSFDSAKFHTPKALSKKTDPLSLATRTTPASIPLEISPFDKSATWGSTAFPSQRRFSFLTADTSSTYSGASGSTFSSPIQASPPPSIWSKRSVDSNLSQVSSRNLDLFGPASLSSSPEAHAFTHTASDPNLCLTSTKPESEKPSSMKAANAAACFTQVTDQSVGSSSSSTVARTFNRRPTSQVYRIINSPDYTPAKVSRYFVIKSFTERHVLQAYNTCTWSSTEHGTQRLHRAFWSCREQAQECGETEFTVLLYFSVNESRQFCGVAELVHSSLASTPSLDPTKPSEGAFSLRWIFVKDVPNSALRHILVKNNMNKPVTNSRDTQELFPDAGIEVLNVFKDYDSTSSFIYV
ncbi:hypothetical protein CANCADRAFT_32989 [Tortispora caseinolytica NRRL Y-17796]|uniref:YTH domain-containing protein n=1 Tax=Tortispora caseinolytica NRRL Y-17796 TaxID=767744 RepID=A0A1E4T9D9_9ASCO|nr:hypothetical protein CANCADRAFT_32989 [Tortispora caseinolytica NRRL Y-17796]